MRWVAVVAVIGMIIMLWGVQDSPTGYAVRSAHPEPIRSPVECPGEIAHCYDIVSLNETRPGIAQPKPNGTSVYEFPERRLRTYVCVGNDTACINSSIACYCPKVNARTPTQPYIAKGLGRCTDGTHLCRDSYATLTACYGNLSSCNEQYGDCGCGRYSACPATKLNVCIDQDNRLILCKAPLHECLSRYRSCSCDSGMLKFQQQCTTWSHACVRGGRNITCYGPFEKCAMRFDRCLC